MMFFRLFHSVIQFSMNRLLRMNRFRMMMMNRFWGMMNRLTLVSNRFRLVINRFRVMMNTFNVVSNRIRFMMNSFRLVMNRFSMMMRRFRVMMDRFRMEINWSSFGFCNITLFRLWCVMNFKLLCRTFITLLMNRLNMRFTMNCSIFTFQRFVVIMIRFMI